MFYEAWLGTEDGKPKRSIGHLVSNYGDVRHSIRFESDDDLRNEIYLIVTRESDDGNPASSLPVATGKMKHQER